MNTLYDNDALVAEYTRAAQVRGVDIFQIWKYGLTNREHCAWLLGRAMFPVDAYVLDIACGVGTVALTMMGMRPDLHFALHNISLSQLNLCPPGLKKYRGSIDTLANVPDQTFDAAMVCYALGHVEQLDKFFTNVARVLKPGGTLFVYDVLPEPGNKQWMKDELEYNTYTIEDICKAVNVTKLLQLTHSYSLDKRKFNVGDFGCVCGLAAAYETFSKTKPVAYRFRKR
mgnify:CR=1 FL=1